MALSCRQCGLIGSVVDTICSSCGAVLTNGSMPAINNFNSFGASNLYQNNPSQNYRQENKQQPWQSYQQQNEHFQPHHQQQNNFPLQNHHYQQPVYNQPVSYPSYPQQNYLPPPQQFLPPPQPGLSGHWQNNQNNPGQQVFVINNVHPANIYQEKKNPAVSVLLSVLLTGAGQVYNGQIVKGLLMLGSCIVLWGFLLGWIISIWSVYDAYTTAKKINVGQPV
jgi:TM2 domain-containing membrane protein YozV